MALADRFVGGGCMWSSPRFAPVGGESGGSPGISLHVRRGEELAWGALVLTEGRGDESRGVVWLEEIWEARRVGVVVVLRILWLSSSS